MSNTSRIEIKKFNGQNFELWKLKMEDILVDREQWVVVEPRTKLIGMLDEYWTKLDRSSKYNLTLSCKFGIAECVGGRHRKEVVGKITEHLNAFNIVISQLLSVD